MFNIRNRIYVTMSNDIDFTSKRFLMLDSMYSTVAITDFVGWEEKTRVGCVGKYDSLSQFVTTVCGGNVRGLFDRLTGEDRLVIVVDAFDYITLYAYVMCELMMAFNVSADHIELLISKQQLKDYLSGYEPLIPLACSDEFLTRFNSIKSTYTRSYLYSLTDMEALPFEFAVALTVWKYVDGAEFNTKMRVIAKMIFESEVRSILSGAELSIARDPAILREYLNNQNITTSQDVINAIQGDTLLFNVFVLETFDLDDPDQLESICKLCELAINYYKGREERDFTKIEEFRASKEIFLSKDISIMAATSNHLVSEALAELGGKYNKLAMISLI